MLITTDKLRELYLDFFRSKNHKFFSSDSLIPANDPSLLFTGAGMNQFKAYFLGQKKDVARATSCQKCIRTADLDRVGKTAYHHTFFEMLGNFSFGDYFKEEAIEWAWEFVTEQLRFSKDNLWVSVYQEDEEAKDIWVKKIGLNPSRVVKMDAHDNFWPANAVEDGPNGPCGPCSEIYVGSVPGQGVEIWNLVFTQFDRQSNGTLKALPQKNIDTGMGLERLSAVMQGVASNFDTDNFVFIRKALKQYTRVNTNFNPYSHENAVMDHIRAVIFSIADGALPSNEGRGYVVRKLIRYASDHFKKAGCAEEGNLHKLVAPVIERMSSVYTDLPSKQKNIESIVENEEQNYLQITQTFLPTLEKEIRSLSPSDEPEALAFKYRDTHGVPYDNIVEAFQKAGIDLNQKKFDGYMDEQKKRSRQHSKIADEIFSKDEKIEWVKSLPETRFTGYDSMLQSAKILKIIDRGQSVDSSSGENIIVFFDVTPFYAEGGGQVSDIGAIERDSQVVAEIHDVQKIDNVFAHKCSATKELVVGQEYTLMIDKDYRQAVMKNHTATHLLHSALRKTLGEHVKQSGSLVAADKLRFDFTHPKAVESSQLAQIENLVNEQVKADTPVLKKVLPKDQAIKEGAMAFFGEKYSDEVRVVNVGDFSKELCGGTHLDSTAAISVFKITSESSIQSGVRRIEAVTGSTAQTLLANSDSEIEHISRDYSLDPSELVSGLKKMANDAQAELKNLDRYIAKTLQATYKDLILSSKMDDRGLRIIFLENKNPLEVKLLQKNFDLIKSIRAAFILILVSKEVGGKISFVVSASEPVIKSGFNAGQIVKTAVALLQGSGGGRPDIATAGIDKSCLERLRPALESSMAQWDKTLTVGVFQ